MVTAMYCAPYYDEEGVYHHHDANRTTYNHVCSNGHKITVSSTGKCPSCDWGHDSEKVTVSD